MAVEMAAVEGRDDIHENDDKFVVFDNVFECSICIGCLENPIEVQCGHLFCNKCLRTLQETENASCPLCKGKISRRALRSRNDIANIYTIYTKIVEAFTREFVEHRYKASDVTRSEAKSQSNGNVADSEAEVVCGKNLLNGSPTCIDSTTVSVTKIVAEPDIKSCENEIPFGTPHGFLATTQCPTIATKSIIQNTSKELQKSKRVRKRNESKKTSNKSNITRNQSLQMGVKTSNEDDGIGFPIECIQGDAPETSTNPYNKQSKEAEKSESYLPLITVPQENVTEKPFNKGEESEEATKVDDDKVQCVCAEFSHENIVGDNDPTSCSCSKDQTSDKQIVGDILPEKDFEEDNRLLKTNEFEDAIYCESISAEYPENQNSHPCDMEKLSYTVLNSEETYLNNLDQSSIILPVSENECEALDLRIFPPASSERYEKKVALKFLKPLDLSMKGRKNDTEKKELIKSKMVKQKPSEPSILQRSSKIILKDVSPMGDLIRKSLVCSTGVELLNVGDCVNHENFGPVVNRRIGDSDYSTPRLMETMSNQDNKNKNQPVISGETKDVNLKQDELKEDAKKSSSDVCFDDQYDVSQMQLESNINCESRQRSQLMEMKNQNDLFSSSNNIISNTNENIEHITEYSFPSLPVNNNQEFQAQSCSVSSEAMLINSNQVAILDRVLHPLEEIGVDCKQSEFSSNEDVDQDTSKKAGQKCDDNEVRESQLKKRNLSAEFHENDKPEKRAKMDHHIFSAIECIDVEGMTGRTEDTNFSEPEPIDEKSDESSDSDFLNATPTDTPEQNSSKLVPTRKILQKSVVLIQRTPKRNKVFQLASSATCDGKEEKTQLKTSRYSDKYSCNENAVDSVTDKSIESSSPMDATIFSAVETRRSPRNFLFCPTRLTRAQLSKLTTLCAMCTGSITKEYTEKVSHLIINLEKDRVPQTMKYLFAIAGKKWVVVFDWVEKCLEHGQIVEEDPFETANFPQCDLGVQKSRFATTPLFQDFNFCIAGDMRSSGATIDDCKKLLKKLGGMIIDSPDAADFNVMIIGDPLDTTNRYQQWFKSKGWLTASWEWILDCILSFTLVPFTKTHLITNLDGFGLEKAVLPPALLKVHQY